MSARPSPRARWSARWSRSSRRARPTCSCWDRRPPSPTSRTRWRPSTIDELYALLVAIKNDTGKIPLTFANFTEYTENSSALTTLCNDYFIQVIAGTESLDTCDDFVAEWEAAGGKALEDAAIEWYHAHPELVDAARKSTSPYNDVFGYTIN